MRAKTRLASKAKADATRLAEKCEELARAADEKARAAKTDEEVIRAQDESRAYWKMATDWQATARRAEEITPSKFNAQNKGPSEKTRKKQEFLIETAKEIGTTKRQDVALAALQRDGFNDHFDSYESAYRAAVPEIFNGIRKSS